MTRRLPLHLTVLALILAAVLAHEARAQATVRLSYYLPTGSPTASGVYPYEGSAACSYNWPLGTVLALPDREVICLDRGMLGSIGWVDVFVRSHAEGQAMTAALGDETEATVERWGW